MLVSLAQNIIAYHCTSDAPCWNKHGSLLCRGTGTAHIGKQPWREMLNKGLKTFCWTRSRKAPSKHSSAKLSWLWRKCLLTCQSLEGVPSYHQNTQQNKKGHPVHQTSFPIWTPPWRRACSRVCEGAVARQKLHVRFDGLTTCDY